MAAHELLADADAQDGLRERRDDPVEPVFPKVVHRITRLALTREDNPVGTAQRLGRIRQQRFHAHPLQGMDDGKDVPRVVFHYGNLHLTSTI